MKKIFFIITLISVSTVFAQTKNIFLDRDFWKTNPSISIVDEKIAEGNDISELTRFGFDGFVYGLLENVNNKTLKYLLTKKGNGVNKLTHDGRTYIFWAAYKNNVEIMKHLLANGAKTDIIDDKGYSLLNFAAVTGQQNPELYDLILAKEPNMLKQKTPKGADALLLLIPKLKDLKFTKYFTDKGLDLYSLDKDGNGAFNYTAQTGNIKMLDLLIEKGFPYKKLNKEEGNAMLFATRRSRQGYNPLSFYKYLERLGISPNIVTKKGETPLHNIAYGSKDIETIEYFINKGQDVNTANEKGNTPFLLATYRNSLEVIKMLSPRVKDINKKNKEGQTALSNAVRSNTPEVVKYLLSKGADASVKDVKGNNLAYYLVQSFNSKRKEEFQSKIALLSEAKFDITELQQNGNTLYHLAVEKGDLKLLKTIQKFSVAVNAKNREGLTAFHKAAMTAKNDEILKYLLSIGADKHAKTDFGETAWELAAENELLKEQKADISFLK